MVPHQAEVLEGRGGVWAEPGRVYLGQGVLVQDEGLEALEGDQGPWGHPHHVALDGEPGDVDQVLTEEHGGVDAPQLWDQHHQ